ncbi:unnamed protein product [Closterium sp. NIES-65]|nr:unnamed protein product [Closterium sp. NIES-65]
MFCGDVRTVVQERAGGRDDGLWTPASLDKQLMSKPLIAFPSLIMLPLVVVLSRLSAFLLAVSVFPPQCSHHPCAFLLTILPPPSPSPRFLPPIHSFHPSIRPSLPSIPPRGSCLPPVQRLIDPPVPLETKDPDEVVESEFFGTRQAFLSLCQALLAHATTCTPSRPPHPQRPIDPLVPAENKGPRGGGGVRPIDPLVPSETKDPDEVVESEFFDTRQAFLSLCQGNHYQYDTLRRTKHSSLMRPIDPPVPTETKDPDEVVESEFFDTRQAFLSLCQGNHYQYDTLRRAKHSSLMVLYHLHNPTAPAFVVTCNACQRDIENRQGWRCEQCPDYDVCAQCKDTCGHPHPLVSHASQPDRNAQSQEGRQQRIKEVRKMLELLAHAASCRPQPGTVCTYPKCSMVKMLFRHGTICAGSQGGSGGQTFEAPLKSSICPFSLPVALDDLFFPPTRRDLKEHFRRSAQQMESRRRKAVQEMMRQRAAEAAGGALKR